MSTTLNGYDILAVVAYFVLVIAIGIYATCSSNRGSVKGYFLAGRFMTFLPVGASVFASNIGSEHFIGLVGSGAASGLGVGAFELDATILLQVLGHVFIPVYIASQVSTLPEYMERRFGGKKRIRLYLTFLSIILYIFTKISVNLYSGALFIERALDWSMYSGIVGILILTALTTIGGGLTAVIYTDTLQTAIMLIGAAIVAGKSMVKIGGWQGLQNSYRAAIPNVTYAGTECGYPRDDAFTILRDPVTGDIPWPGFFLGQFPSSTWYWCADQIMVQRVLAAKSLSHAQTALVFAGYLKLLPLFLMVVPGMVARALFPDTIGCATEETCMAFCNSKASCSNLAYPELVLSIMPTGLKGIMIAVMLAALMSDLTSIFNSASTLFTIDVWPQFRKRADTKELLVVGRLFVVLMTVISVMWIPLLEVLQGGQLFVYIQSVSAYLAPPIAAVYILAITCTWINETGAFYGLCTGTVVGIIRMIMEFSYSQPRCGLEDSRPVIVTLHYMYFAIIGFWITAITTLLVSKFTPPPSPEHLINTTVWTRTIKESKLDGIEGEVPSPESIQLTDVNYKEEEKKKAEENGSPEPEQPFFKKVCYWICGFNEMSTEEEQPPSRINTIYQSRAMKWFTRGASASIVGAGFTMYIVFSTGKDL